MTFSGNFQKLSPYFFGQEGLSFAFLRGISLRSVKAALCQSLTVCHTCHPFDRSIDIRVTRLRRKIETDPAAPAYVRTIRGEGYLFNPRGSET